MTIVDMLKELWKHTLGTELVDWPIKLGVFVFFVAYGMFRAGLKEEGSRADLIGWIRRGAYKRRYQGMLLWLLQRSDRWFLKDMQFRELPATSWRRAFSIGLFEKALALAFLYAPILFFTQILFGIRAQIGPRHGINISLDQLIWLIMFFALIFLTLVPKIKWLVLLLALLLILWRWPFPPDMHPLDKEAFIGYFVALTIMCSAIVAIFFAFAALGWPRPFGPLLALAVTVLLGLGGLAALFGYEYSTEWWPDLGKILLAQGERLGYQEDETILFAYFFSDRTWLVVSFVVSVGAIWIGSRLYRKYPDRISMPILLVLGLLVFQALMAAGGWGNPNYFVLFAALPLLNAVFDFVSIGVTRFCLRKGVRTVGWQTLKWSAIDLSTALVVFFVLGCACLGWIHFLNILSPDQLIVIKTGTFPVRQGSGLLDHLIEGSDSHYWYFVVLLSTLIPTVFHASVAFFALGPALLSRSLCNRLADVLEQSKEHYYLRNLGLSALSLWAAVSIILPIVVVSAGFTGIMTQGPELRSLALVPFEVFISWLPEDQSLFPE